MQDLSKLSAVPESILHDITDAMTAHGDLVPEKSQTVANGLKNTVTDAEIHKTGQTADLQYLNVSQSPITPNGGNTANPTNSVSNPVQNMSLGQLVDGKLATELMDTVFPSLVVIALNYMGIKQKKADIQLSEKEKATIAPVMQSYLNSLQLSFNNPLNALLITLGSIYGAKIAEKVLTGMTEMKTEQPKRDAIKKALSGRPTKEVEQIMKQKKVGRERAEEMYQKQIEKQEAFN